MLRAVHAEPDWLLSQYFDEWTNTIAGALSVHFINLCFLWISLLFACNLMEVESGDSHYRPSWWDYVLWIVFSDGS